MNDILLDQLNKERIETRNGVLLSSLTSFRIGGPCRGAVFPRSAEDMKKTLAVLSGERVFVLGNGTNVLFSDGGFDGYVISTTALSGFDTRDEGENVKITALSGTGMTSLAFRCARLGYSGLEFAYGIPGSVGGAVYMNAGAYEHDVSEVVLSSEYVTESGSEGVLNGKDHSFGYRKSAYMDGGKVIISATFTLKKDDAARSMALCDEYMARRKAKQPLEYPSAGSFFKRCPGHYTGEMIEKCGLKGFSVGGARVSEKHAGFIINAGGATAKDVTELARIVAEKVFDKFGVRIENEVRLIEC